MGWHGTTCINVLYIYKKQTSDLRSFVALLINASIHATLIPIWLKLGTRLVWHIRDGWGEQVWRTLEVTTFDTSPGTGDPWHTSQGRAQPYTPYPCRGRSTRILAIVGKQPLGCYVFRSAMPYASPPLQANCNSEVSSQIRDQVEGDMVVFCVTNERPVDSRGSRLLYDSLIIEAAQRWAGRVHASFYSYISIYFG